jgi:hypothetical protein
MPDDQETEDARRKRLAMQNASPVSSTMGYNPPRYGGILQHLGEMEPQDPRYTAAKLRNGRAR